MIEVGKLAPHVAGHQQRIDTKLLSQGCHLEMESLRFHSQPAPTVVCEPELLFSCQQTRFSFAGHLRCRVLLLSATSPR